MFKVNKFETLQKKFIVDNEKEDGLALNGGICLMERFTNSYIEF